MSRLLYTVDNLVDEVRSQLDESNFDSVNTVRDILPALNRGQDFAMDIYARKYPTPILRYETMVLTGDTQEYDIPEYIFEDRLLKVEIQVGNRFREVRYISYNELSNYETGSTSSVPGYCTLIGRKLRFIPKPTGAYNARIWYVTAPEALTLPQGRITIVNKNSNYVIVDAIRLASEEANSEGTLTTESDKLGSYVNIVDGQTGIIKGSVQIQLIDTDKITFRATPTRSSVLNRTISLGLGSIDVAPDDYLAPISGTCVPFFARPTGNFLIQFAVSELTRKLGGDAPTEEAILDKFEKQLEKSWATRPNQLRVKRRSRIWGFAKRRAEYFD